MFNEKGQRVCDHCGAIMYEGYIIEDGREHYCSDECLFEHYTMDEYLELYDKGYGSSCYSEWYDEIPENECITKHEFGEGAQ